MRYASVLGQSPKASFREALFRGLAPDGSLYVPETIPRLNQEILKNLPSFGLQDLSFEIISPFVEGLASEALQTIIKKALNFPIPLVKLEENFFLLELFHGPTFAFKDVGARFMAECLSCFLGQEKKKITILVATSGDTGSAVANGFFNTPNIDVFVLYPSGKISSLQEKQMTTLGGNIHAIEIEGTFDDCQRLLKEALKDPEIQAQRTLTTANSINLGRLIPQITYYAWAIAQWQKNFFDAKIKPTFVVPSGNFGNVTACVYAKEMGLPLGDIIAVTNANDGVVEYLETGKFTSRPSVKTLSNAMDVGNPSNLARLQFLCKNDVNSLRQKIESLSVSDEETLDEIKTTYGRTGYILDPHTAVGVRAARRLVNRDAKAAPFIVTATAHSAKFPEIVESAIGKKIALPQVLQDALSRPKQSLHLPAQYPALKDLLMNFFS